MRNDSDGSLDELEPKLAQPSEERLISRGRASSEVRSSSQDVAPRPSTRRIAEEASAAGVLGGSRRGMGSSKKTMVVDAHPDHEVQTSHASCLRTRTLRNDSFDIFGT